MHKKVIVERLVVLYRCGKRYYHILYRLCIGLFMFSFAISYAKSATVGKVLWHTQGNLYQDLFILKQQCPVTLDTPVYCKLLYFLNFNDFPKAYKNTHYKLALYEVANKLEFQLTLSGPKKQHLKASVDIVDADMFAFKKFLANQPDYNTFSAVASVLFNQAYFENFQLASTLKPSINLQSFFMNAFSINTLLSAKSTQSIEALLSIHTQSAQKQKTIVAEYQLGDLAFGWVTVNFHIDHPVYLKPILFDLGLWCQACDVNLENAVYFDSATVQYQNIALIEALLPYSNTYISKPALQHITSQYVQALSAEVYQKHSKAFLAALSSFIKKPESISLSISSGHSVYSIKDAWHYMIEYVLSLYNIDVAMQHPALNIGVKNDFLIKQSKKNLIKDRTRLYQIYLDDLKFKYVIY